MHHPWRALKALADWSLVWDHLPGDLLGFTDHRTRTVVLDRDLLQVERRCTIAHELEHVHRGPVPADPWLGAREESAVEQEAARALISIEALADAVSWSLDVHEVADALWVDVDTLRVRLAHLHPAERALLARKMEHHLDHAH
ncbi:ImmA/IrrE family metallo-endopeptidase [Aestuariimicrobium sp. p3-SID1156]|uniref:ImmA/IrrE family metallo-endopeptidase n=1 Tax=Aestuariimicrobium sp. p3-SID1156 TaxID=2916038 RepID=UPI00223ADC4E|nr:ImmA/IrrE family metallo-endopeptidase [Aestuariimicrobium sp. p3-SID1156]